MAQEDRSMFWSRENEVSEEWIQFVDDNVLAGKAERERSIIWPLTNLRSSELPQGTQIIGAFPHGASYWTRTAEIETQQADGSELSFFIKVCVISLSFEVLVD
jgi:protein-ribulosamine 3-kinase